MGVEDEEFAHARTRHALGHLQPDGQRRLGRQTQCPWKGRVFYAVAHPLHGQAQHRVGGFESFTRRGPHGFDQNAVHLQWQMRSVLLRRTEGQDRHRATGIEPRKLGAAQAIPAKLARRKVPVGRNVTHPRILRASG